MDLAGRNANQVPVIQWPCSGINNQRFQASRDLPNFASRRSRVAGTSTHCLDVPGELAPEAAAMQIWDCNGTPAQTFGVFPV